MSPHLPAGPAALAGMQKEGGAMGPRDWGCIVTIAGATGTWVASGPMVPSSATTLCVTGREQPQLHPILRSYDCVL